MGGNSPTPALAFNTKQEINMSIQAGDKVPSTTLKTMGSEGPTDISTDEIFTGKKVVLFAVPGAFTPGCSLTHLPGYVVHADKIKAKGVDTIVCMSVNDAFVMGAWGEAQNASEILMLADGNGDLTSALGLELDGSGFGMGKRSQRFAMIVEDGTVTHLNVEPAGGVDVSSAETMMELL
jgi:peroxiredoxin